MKLVEKYKNQKRWCNWIYREVDGKQTKVPLAKSNDPTTWSVYNDVIDKGNVGFMAGTKKLFLLVDFDHCIENGVIVHSEKEKVEEFIAKANSYTELSPSGTGIHIYIELSDPLEPEVKKHNLNKLEKYEMYTSGRFFTVTNIPFGEPKDVRTITSAEAIELLGVLGYPWKKEPAPVIKAVAMPVSLSDSELLNKMFTSSNGAEVKALYYGDLSKHNNDASTADMALCSHLAFWTGKDAGQIERLWITSPLGSRGKTQERSDYRKMTISKAVDNCKVVYTGHQTTTLTPVEEKATVKEKNRYLTYELELSTSYPHLRKNEIGMIFNYNNGVYKMMTDQNISDIILRSLANDGLLNFRTRKHVADKTACLLSIIPDLIITPDQGRILNCKNGLLDIYTRELKPHTPEFVSLIQSPMNYDPDAKCPTWEACMEAWMAGDERFEKELLLQQFAGYCLSSSMKHDRALFLIGEGGNGKSTFVDTISMVIGSEATSHIEMDGLYSTFGLDGLIGKRLNVIEEIPNNYYQSHRLKKLISGEKITIDIKYKPQFTFRPQAKFIFAVNRMPRVDDTSTATERRICAVQFLNSFVDNPNTNLRTDMGLLYQELPGILNWMLDGAKSLIEVGNFVKTKEQTKLLSDYRQENSSVEGFIGDCLEFGEGKIATTRELYDHYKKYCVADGMKAKSNRGFTSEMKAYGSRSKKYQFIERRYSGDTSSFEGVAIDQQSKNEIKEDYGVW